MTRPNIQTGEDFLRFCNSCIVNGNFVVMTYQAKDETAVKKTFRVMNVFHSCFEAQTTHNGKDVVCYVNKKDYWLQKEECLVVGTRFVLE